MDFPRVVDASSFYVRLFDAHLGGGMLGRERELIGDALRRAQQLRSGAGLREPAERAERLLRLLREAGKVL